MSFDIYIGSEEVGNYTYNCNPMAALALNAITDGRAGAGDGSIDEIMGFKEKNPRSGLFAFQGAPAVEAAGLLSQMVAEMEANPAPYKALNPNNGWGDFDSFLDYLRRFRDTAIANPTDRIEIL